jgi:hypothetical protein
MCWRFCMPLRTRKLRFHRLESWPSPLPMERRWLELIWQLRKEKEMELQLQ